MIRASRSLCFVASLSVHFARVGACDCSESGDATEDFSPSHVSYCCNSLSSSVHSANKLRLYSFSFTSQRHHSKAYHFRLPGRSNLLRKFSISQKLVLRDQEQTMTVVVSCVCAVYLVELNCELRFVAVTLTRYESSFLFQTLCSSLCSSLLAHPSDMCICST